MKTVFSFFILLSQFLLAAERPNIVWIIPDDMSAHFGCYGETAIRTPHLDALATRGVKFTNAVVTAPVCSTCRSAFITGMYQTTIGAHHHRSGRGVEKIHLPKHLKLVPQLFQEAGYHTSISAWPPQGKKLGKTDYNFEWDENIYDGNDWAGREDGQPFFAQIQTPGGKLRGHNSDSWERIQKRAEKVLGTRTPDSAVKLPPYYPNHPDLIRDWAAYLDSVRLTDHMIGEVIARLKKEELLENTLILFMTDHGISHARGKQFLYEEGIYVPLVIAGPGITANSVRADPVEHIDITALSLGAAGIPVPGWMQARDILADDYEPRSAVFSARDRCDETVDHMRSVRTKRYKYIRNFLPQRPYLQPCAYKDAKQILIALRSAKQAGTINEAQLLQFRETRPKEELYDLKNDPFELTNLVDAPSHQEILYTLRGRLTQWMEDTKDLGRHAEPEVMFESDMATYLQSVRRRKKQDHVQILEDNISLMKRWKREGK